MTCKGDFSMISLADREFVLATDLDGTFLGGSTAERRAFYDWIEAQRERVGLVFVTGRDPAFITSLTRDGCVPRPDYVVGDVGTTIAAVTPDHDIRPLASLEKEIAKAWGNAGDKVCEMLSDVPGLALQNTPFRYRMSFDLDPANFDQGAVTRVEALGLDVLISDNRFFDVLPKGVSKGPTLRRLLAHLDVEPGRTLVAGDTLNDFSMLAMGLPAVAVGGSEPALLDKLGGLGHVHFAEGLGVTGIAEAICHHGLFSEPAPQSNNNRRT
jgi:HAD superfamily hydrolase (TIGR01484 family)